MRGPISTAPRFDGSGLIRLTLVVVCALLLGPIVCGGCDRRDKLVIKKSATFRLADDVAAVAGPAPIPRGSDGSVSSDQTGLPTTLTIGFDPDWPPYTFVTEDGRVTGFDIDVTTTVLNRMGLSHRFAPTRIGELIDGIEAGRLHLATGLSITPARRERLRFTAPHGTYERVLFVHDNAAPLEAADAGTLLDRLDQLDGFTLGVPKGGADREIFADRPGLTLLDVPTNLRCFHLLVGGRVDGCPTERRVGTYLIERNRFPIQPIDLPLRSYPHATAISPRLDEVLLTAYNTALREIRQDGTLKLIQRRWFGTDDGLDSTTEPERNRETAK